MRQSYLQQDMVSEQKNLLGFMSYRQAAYCFVTVLILYTICPPVVKIAYALFGLVGSVILGIIVIVPFVFITVFLAFTKNKKTGYYRDKDYLIRFMHKHEYGYWRKGTSNNMKSLDEEWID